MLTYTVQCELADERVMEEFLAWLTEGHLADVCAAGALDAELVRLDGTPLRLESRYRFASREAFETYERDHAPRLRAEGLARFPPERGVSMRRSVGVSLLRVSRPQRVE